MAYLRMVRYSGTSKSPEELDRRAIAELVPDLKQLAGMLRFMTLVFDDGRVGSHVTGETHDVMQRAGQMGREWASKIESQAQRDLVLEGESIQTYYAGSGSPTAYAVHLYRDCKTPDGELRAACEGAVKTVGSRFPGLIRWACARLDGGGGVAVFRLHDTQENAKKALQIVKGMPDSPMAKALGGTNPETIYARVLNRHIDR